MSIKNSARFSFFSGLISLILCWYFWYPVWGSVLSFLCLLLSVAAVVFGRNALKHIRPQPNLIPRPQRRNAKFGYVLGLIGIFIATICFIFSLLFTFYYHFLI